MWEKLKNIQTIETSGELKIPLEDESVDVILLYDVLHSYYFTAVERKELLTGVYRISKPDALISVYPKHTLEDGSIQEFRRLSLSDVKREIEASNFVFERRFCGLISHDDDLNQGCVLNFTKCK